MTIATFVMTMLGFILIIWCAYKDKNNNNITKYDKESAYLIYGIHIIMLFLLGSTALNVLEILQK